MIRFRTVALSIFLILLAHVVIMATDAYHTYSWLDIPMHFFGGYAMALFGMAVYGVLTTHVDIRTNSSRGKHAKMLIEFGFVLGFAVIIGVAWEWFEFLVDQFATQFVSTYGAAQLGLPDTMDDLFNDTIGAITAWLLWRSKE